ncbi:uncharacterized protein LOC110708630 [Chenopodium quinoa]|uniref:uncharacterized protein LOC110708630 n=1 Tax=Chenopodium quinoa TaxID=63459 RepID=UPI000B77A13D|nr:uncharacterized protein LOC110708630 [Chenopodium quinoa]
MGEDKIDSASPFYPGSGDQPGNLISHVILKGDNYLAWSRAITLSLKSRRKFGFVDGTINKPAEKKKLLDWETVNSMLVSWVLRAIEPKIAASIPYFEEVKKLWDYLEKRFCESSGPRLQQLRAAITNCKQTKAMSIEEYYTTLMGYYGDLLRLKPPHGCECGKCECDVAAKIELDREEEKLHQFWVGIDDDKYSVVRTNLLSQQPPTSLERAYQALLQEERSRNIAQSKSQTEDAHVFALLLDRKSVQSSHRVDKSKLYCTHCKRSGHENSGCFMLHGYPDWWLEKYGKKGGGPSAARPSSSAPAATLSAASASASTAAAPRHAATDHGKAVVRAIAVGGVSSSPSPDTLSALSDLQPEHIKNSVEYGHQPPTG